MKRSKKFELFRVLYVGGWGTSATQSIDETPVKVENEPQMTDQSTILNNLNEEDWPSQDGFRVGSCFSDLTKGSSQATESEREMTVSSSISTSSRRSSVQGTRFEANEAKMAEMDYVLPRMLTQIQTISAPIPLHQQKPAVLESAINKLPNNLKLEPMTAPTKFAAPTKDTRSLNNTTTGIANTSPVDHIADDGLLESNPCTSDKIGELISPEQ